MIWGLCGAILGASRGVSRGTVLDTRLETGVTNDVEDIVFGVIEGVLECVKGEVVECIIEGAGWGLYGTNPTLWVLVTAETDGVSSWYLF